MKGTVYRWRISRRLKTESERAARKHKTDISVIVKTAAREWLVKHKFDTPDEIEQSRLHAAAEVYLGVFRGGNPRRAEMTVYTVRKILRRRYKR